MSEAYEMDDADKALLLKCAKAVRYFNNGDPMKDALDSEDFEGAIVLLVALTGTQAPSSPQDDDDDDYYDDTQDLMDRDMGDS